MRFRESKSFLYNKSVVSYVRREPKTTEKYNSRVVDLFVRILCLFSITLTWLDECTNFGIRVIIDLLRYGIRTIVYVFVYDMTQ